MRLPPLSCCMVCWGRTLKRWKVYLLNYFEHRTTNAYTEGVHTKMKLLKRASYGLRNIEVYVKKMLLGFLPPLFLYFHHIF
jgi:transposase